MTVEFHLEGPRLIATINGEWTSEIALQAELQALQIINANKLSQLLVDLRAADHSSDVGGASRIYNASRNLSASLPEQFKVAVLVSIDDEVRDKKMYFEIRTQILGVDAKVFTGLDTATEWLDTNPI